MNAGTTKENYIKSFLIFLTRNIIMFSQNQIIHKHYQIDLETFLLIKITKINYRIGNLIKMKILERILMIKIIN